MGQYLSSYTGKQIDSVIKKVLEGKDGIQSVSVNGTAITPDPSNNVDISVPIVSQSTGDSTTQTMSQASITTSLSQKANISSLPTISQSTGSSTTSVMSQNAVTNALNAKASINSLSRVATSGSYSDLTNKPTIPSVSQSTGSSTTSVMSQKAVTDSLPTIETGTFVPRLSCRADEGGTTDPTYTIYYNYGKYKRIDNICFVTFHIKAKITNKGVGYSTIANLPYKSATNVGGQALALQELGGSIKGADGISEIVRGMGATIPDETQQVNLEHNNGMAAITWDTGDVWVGCTGFYFINE